MKKMDYGKDYKYAHQFENHFVQMEFLPEKLKGSVIYDTADNSAEEKMRNTLSVFWKEHYKY